MGLVAGASTAGMLGVVRLMGDAPIVVGDEWFEGLRPHLPATGENAKYRTAHEVHCDNATVATLSLEIGRIERQWVDEAKSFPRRARK